MYWSMGILRSSVYRLIDCTVQMDEIVFENIKRVYRRQILSQLIEDEEHDVFEIVKLFNVKTVICMVAKYWKQVARSTLIKS